MGTAFADAFIGYISQNAFSGGVSNTLSSADRLNGGAGADSLFAELVPEFFGVTGDNQVDVQPRTTFIETIAFEARDTGANDTYGSPDELITVDAKYITGHNKIGSKFSDGDLLIENLTTLTDAGVARNTDAITITMDHTDNFDSDEDASDLTVLFDEDYLLAGQTAESQAIYFLLDQDSDMVGGPLLDSINTNGLQFSVDGGPVQVLQFDVTLLTGGTVNNHAEFVAALQSQLAALIAAGTVPSDTTLTVNSSLTRTTFLDNGAVSSDIPAMVLQTQTSAVLTAVGFRWISDLSGDFNVYGRVSEAAAVAAEPISVDVELNKVGRDGEGGDLVIGGKDQNWKSDTDVDQADGITVFNISVLGDDELPSNLGYISSTNQALTTVNISTADTTLASFASLTIREAFNGAEGNYNDTNLTNIETVNANTFLGDLIIGIADPAQNIDTFTAAGGGDVTLVESITGDERSNFSVATGTGNDVITVSLDGDAVDALNTGLTITTASGDDYVTVTGEDGVSDETTLELRNLSISTGAGEDSIDVYAEHIYLVNAGADSDFVRVDAQPDEDGDTGIWTIGDGTGGPIGGPADWADRVLYQAKVTVDFAGFTQTVAIDTNAAGFFIATQLDINNAVIAAIEANPELARLLSTRVSTGSEGNQLLTITSTVEGVNDLTIQVVQPEVFESGATGSQVNFTASHLGAVQIGLVRTTTLDSADTNTVPEVVTELNLLSGNLDETGAPSATDFVLDSADGNDGDNNTGATSHAIIDMSTGANDLIALDSDVDSADTLVFSNTWGKVSVLNFFDAQYNDVAQAGAGVDTTVITHDDETVGDHILDFTAWLDDQTTASGSTLSALRVFTTVQTDGASAMAVLSNQVTIVDDFTVGVDATETWANLTAAHLQNSLNDVDVGTVGTGYANFTEASATDPGQLLGTTTIDTIIMVENNTNPGEYKVYNADVSDLGATDTFAVTYLGIIDFGESINVGLVGVTDLNFAGFDPAAVPAP